MVRLHIKEIAQLTFAHCIMQICEHFRPCLHYFFLERFRDPASWFEKRLAYTRSTAVNSMAGSSNLFPQLMTSDVATTIAQVFQAHRAHLLMLLGYPAWAKGFE